MWLSRTNVGKLFLSSQIILLPASRNTAGRLRRWNYVNALGYTYLQTVTHCHSSASSNGIYWQGVLNRLSAGMEGNSKWKAGRLYRCNRGLSRDHYGRV